MRLLILLLITLLSYSVFTIKHTKINSQARESSCESKEEDISLTSLIINSIPQEDAVLTFNNGGSNSFIFALEGEGGAFVAKNENYKILDVTDADKTLTFNSNTFTARNISYVNNLYYQGVQQWKLAIQENFWDAVSGWSINKTSICGGVTMLGGYKILATGNLTKAITELPTHTVVRIRANIHFIDAWEGQMAYLFADVGTDHAYKYLWTQWNDFSDAENDLSICGSEFGEAKFTTMIDVTIPHSEDNLNLIFGTTAIEVEPDYLSWGISSFEIYLL